MLAYNKTTKWGGTMTTEEGKKHSPPYVSYKNLRHFLTQLQPQPPTGWSQYLGRDVFRQHRYAIKHRMRFLNLIDVNSRPHKQPKTANWSLGEHRAVLLRQVADEAYAFVLKGTLDIPECHLCELEDVFQNTYRMKSDVCRKVYQVLYRIF